MSDLALVLLAAGNSTRFDLPVKKQWLRIGHDPLWHFVTSSFEKTGLFDTVVIAAHPDEIEAMRPFGTYRFVEGGATRQASLRNALEAVESSHVLVSDVARACIDERFLRRIIAKRDEADCVVPALNVSDTVVYDGQTIDRDRVRRVQTPQLSNTAVLKAALASDVEHTDESSAIVAAGGTRLFIDGDAAAHKLTFEHDLLALPCTRPPAAAMLAGNGMDVHAFEPGKPMVLGGVAIDSPFGFKAHSDGDVAIHALIDALLGAAGMGDIGTLFPDTDEAYRDIDSKTLLETVVQRLHRFGLVVNNVDLTIAAQVPRLGPYKAAMRHTLAERLHVGPSRVNVKATTTERLGFVGREEGVCVLASATLTYYDWTQS